MWRKEGLFREPNKEKKVGAAGEPMLIHYRLFLYLELAITSVRVKHSLDTFKLS